MRGNFAEFLSYSATRQTNRKSEAGDWNLNGCLARIRTAYNASRHAVLIACDTGSPRETARSFYVAASLGFEPRQRDSESLVLPLHYEATLEKIKTDNRYYKSSAWRVAAMFYATATFASSRISAPS